MKKLVVLPILCLLLVVCIKPDRDNEYDPNNPSKVRLEGKVHGFDENPVADAWIVLTDEDYSDTVEQYTDNEGWYEFERVNPGIYTIIAQGAYYYFECYPESLPAGTDTVFDIDFSTAYWDFEHEPLGVQEPKGFRIVDTMGTWRIVGDPQQNHVYEGVTPGTGLALAVTDIGANSFYYESMFKVDPGSVGFFAGLMFRFQDPQNHYIVFCSSNSMALIEVFAGGWSTIDTTARAFQLDTWYSLAVECCDNNIKVYVNSESTPVFDVTSNTFPGGRVGLFVKHLTTVRFGCTGFEP